MSKRGFLFFEPLGRPGRLLPAMLEPWLVLHYIQDISINTGR